MSSAPADSPTGTAKILFTDQRSDGPRAHYQAAFTPMLVGVLAVAPLICFLRETGSAAETVTGDGRGS
jgi:hypothetical protein